MIKTGSIYLVVKDFDKSLDFYKQLLEKDVSAQNKTRFAIFHLNSLCIFLMNGYFDTENPEQVVTLVLCQDLVQIKMGDFSF